MKLVIGGAFQGKLEYAKQTYQIEEGWIDGRDCPLWAITECRGIHHFHEYLRRLFLLTDAHGRALYAAGKENRRSDQQSRKAARAEDRHLLTNGADVTASTGENLRTVEATEREAAGENLLTIETDADRFVRWLTEQNPDIILVSDEVGYGVVPLEKQERTYREVVGRVCTCAAAQANEVTRVVCGIGRRIK